MRVERVGNAGFTCLREFLCSGLAEVVVTLHAPDRRNCADYECPQVPQTVRLVRHIASTGKVRVLMTNLFDVTRLLASVFGDLYHERWRIEEAFKRLNHRLNLEHVTGRSQLAVLQDFAAKVVYDNLQALTVAASHVQAGLPPTHRINRAYAHSALKPLPPALMLGRAVAHSANSSWTSSRAPRIDIDPELLPPAVEATQVDDAAAMLRSESFKSDRLQPFPKGSFLSSHFVLLVQMALKCCCTAIP